MRVKDLIIELLEMPQQSQVYVRVFDGDEDREGGFIAEDFRIIDQPEFIKYGSEEKSFIKVTRKH